MESIVGKIALDGAARESKAGNAWRKLVVIPEDASAFPVSLRALGDTSKGIAEFDGLIAQVQHRDGLVQVATARTADGVIITDAEGTRTL
jgi:hypothetical protein